MTTDELYSLVIRGHNSVRYLYLSIYPLGLR
ncbi:hypothetical protein 20Aug470_00020 [Pseudomonas phage 20Aug470]|nr:hypothetical protein 20Aug470_00020 [Pseudomonas phage 20Aug470]